MTKDVLYKLLDIESPEEFIYYDNMSALLEEETYIEVEHIAELFADVEADILMDLTDTYFEEFLKSIPDDENDLYVLVDQMRRMFRGKIGEEITPDSAADIADEVMKFRKWYALDHLAYERNSCKEDSVRDARFNVLAAKYTGEEFSYDFSNALDYEIDGYDVSVADMLMAEEEEDLEEDDYEFDA